MTPDERRLAIIEAVAPLLVDHGATVTTKQMAEAAGIAEGTLFSVFPDKRSVILATIKQRMDPEPLRIALAAAGARSATCSTRCRTRPVTRDRRGGQAS